MKLMTVVAASVCAVSLSAQVAESNENTTEEEESALFGFGADLDTFSAYVWRNAVQNDEMVMQPCVWVDFNAFDLFTIGGYIWQNFDLTDNRRRGVAEHALTETDYNIHAGYAPWQTEDEDYSLEFEVGHDWYTYQGVRGEDKSGNPETREIYVKTTFANPIVDIYGQTSWMYQDFGDYENGLSYEIGFNREYEVNDVLTVGADWNVSFGNHNYLYYLYGGSDDGSGAYETKECGFGGTTFKLYSSWQITDWLALKGTLAYTGLLNSDLRDACDEQGSDYDFFSDKYPRDLLWGGISLNVEF